VEKPLSAFYNQKGGAQGWRGRCKEYQRAAEWAAYTRDPKIQAGRLRQVKKSLLASEPQRHAIRVHGVVHDLEEVACYGI
jgi:hypothetical protein